MYMFVVWYLLEFNRLHNLHPWYLELSLIQSHLLWREFSIYALCCSYSQSIQFSCLLPPGTHHRWGDRDGMIWEEQNWRIVNGISCRQWAEFSPEEMRPYKTEVHYQRCKLWSLLNSMGYQTIIIRIYIYFTVTIKLQTWAINKQLWNNASNNNVNDIDSLQI